MKQGYFIAQELPDGTAGRPVGDDRGSIAMFDDLELAKPVLASLSLEYSDLAIFCVNISFLGKVVL